MDGFDILRAKWIRIFQTHTRDPQGIHTLATLLHNMDSMKNAGPTISEFMEMATSRILLCVTDPTAMRFGDGRYESTADEYAETFGWFYLKNPRRFRQRWAHFLETAFATIDLNNDGVISVEEYTLWNKTSNLSDEIASKTFGLLDVNGDGVITKREYLDIYLKYICDPDVSDEDLPLFG